MEEGNNKVLILVSVLLIAVVSKLKCLLAAKRPKLNLPPGPWTLPVIGSLHHVVAGPSISRATQRPAQKYGPVMMLRIGEVPTLVVSSAEASEEITKTHDLTFADRYRNVTAGTLFFDGNGMVLAPYGERWRQVRKMCVLELLSVARVTSFRRIREEEVARLLQNLAAASATGIAVDLSMMITRFVNDTFVRESIGSRCEYQDEYLDALAKSFALTSGLAASDLFPSSRLVRALDMAPRKVLACRKRIERILEQIIQEKQQKDTTDDVDEAAGGRKEGFMDVLLMLQKENSMPIPLTNEIVIALMFEMFAGGSDTSSTLLTWCMTELIGNPAVMAKAQAEVRDALKGKTIITEDDIQGLSYLKLLIKEALRLHTPVPILIPRLCRETCQIMGYDIPKGTVVFINAWAICRDPKYWDDPEEFKPERFENSNIDYKGTDYEFLPFGAGRRMCPGMNLGVSNMELALARLLYHFDWKLPNGIEPKDVDISEGSGIVGHKKINLVLHPVVRIAPANA